MAENDYQTGASYEINKLIHEPARLKILAFLSMVETADFVFLLSRTGMTTGNLSSHMTKLETAGYITIEKSFKNNRPHTELSITEEGNKAFDQYRKGMLEILEPGD